MTRYHYPRRGRRRTICTYIEGEPVTQHLSVHPCYHRPHDHVVEEVG